VCTVVNAAGKVVVAAGAAVDVVLLVVVAAVDVVGPFVVVVSHAAPQDRRWSS
jgi:hypothetical protein